MSWSGTTLAPGPRSSPAALRCAIAQRAESRSSFAPPPPSIRRSLARSSRLDDGCSGVPLREGARSASVDRGCAFPSTSSPSLESSTHGRRIMRICFGQGIDPSQATAAPHSHCSANSSVASERFQNSNNDILHRSHPPADPVHALHTTALGMTCHQTACGVDVQGCTGPVQPPTFSGKDSHVSGLLQSRSRRRPRRARGSPRSESCRHERTSVGGAQRGSS